MHLQVMLTVCSIKHYTCQQILGKSVQTGILSQLIFPYFCKMDKSYLEIMTALNHCEINKRIFNIITSCSGLNICRLEVVKDLYVTSHSIFHSPQVRTFRQLDVVKEGMDSKKWHDDEINNNFAFTLSMSFQDEINKKCFKIKILLLEIEI